MASGSEGKTGIINHHLPIYTNKALKEKRWSLSVISKSYSFVEPCNWSSCAYFQHGKYQVPCNPDWEYRGKENGFHTFSHTSHSPIFTLSLCSDTCGRHCGPNGPKCSYIGQHTHLTCFTFVPLTNNGCPGIIKIFGGYVFKSTLQGCLALLYAFFLWLSWAKWKQ